MSQGETPTANRDETKARKTRGRQSRPGWRRLVCLLALPRSGTTVTTAVLGAHSDVYDVYEPWNANKATINAAEPMSYEAFVERFAPPRPECSTLLVKETTTSGKYVERMVQLLDETPPDVDGQMILLLRRPFHVFLSECEARRRWWGAADLAVDVGSFDKWAKRTLLSCRRLAEAAERHDALCVSYDALVREPTLMKRLMETIGIPHEDHRTDYSERIDIRRVRGDPKVTEQSEAMHDRSIDLRQEEWEAVRETLKASPFFPPLRAINHHVRKMKPMTMSSDAPLLMSAMKAGRGGSRATSGKSAKRRTVAPK